LILPENLSRELEGKEAVLVDYVNAFDLREQVLNSNAAEMRGLYGQNYDDLVRLAKSFEDESNQVIVLVKK